MRTGPHTCAVTVSWVAVSTSISVENSRLPSRSFQAIGNTIRDAPVSTKASHRSALERSEAFSIVTEATILPKSISFDSLRKLYTGTKRQRTALGLPFKSMKEFLLLMQNRER